MPEIKTVQTWCREANEKMSFSEVVNPCGLIVHCFVSHFWGHLFSQTVSALRRWAEMNRERMGTESPKSLVFWICRFALNQHAVADEVGENPMQGPFNAALAQAEGGAVMVLDEEINPFKRIWCLFEISRLKELNQPFELICEMGSLSKPESLAVQQADPAAVERLLQATCKALSKVSAFYAKASVKEDQIRIWQEIADPGLRKMLRGNAGALRRGIIEPEGLESAFTEFNRFSQALLSTSLLEFYLVHNQHVAAAKCCEKGACFTQEQFADIITQGISEADRPTWLSNLLVINATDARLGIVRLLLQSRVCMEAVHCSLINAAAGGQEEVTKLLLDHRADAAATNSDGVSALMVAALCGHEEVAKLLLDHRADAAATNSDGVSALMAAAQGGHEAVAKLLLDQGADVLAAANNGATALMLAAHGGHEAVTKLLLDHGADVPAADNNGQTALMLAAARGHEEVAKLLLDQGADVLAAANNGATALMLAAHRGHEAVTKLLLDHGADVAAADNNGQTALMLAAACGHEAVAKVLLDHGADIAAADEDGQTALMLAAHRGHEAVTKLLLNAGAHVAAADNNGQTALINAAFGGHEAVTKLLLNAGADVAAAHNNGQTALINAAFGGHEAVTKLLLDHGADVAAADEDGQTALMLAVAGGHEAVTKVLLDHGADIAKLLLNAGADVAAADEQWSNCADQCSIWWP